MRSSVVVTVLSGFVLAGFVSTSSLGFAADAPDATKHASNPVRPVKSVKTAKSAENTGPAFDAKPSIEKLLSGNEGKIQEALDDVRMVGPRASAAVPTLSDVLGRGLSPALTLAAIETLGDVESEAGSRVLSQYATHRDVKFRRAAVKALLRTKGAVAGEALTHALSDSDAVVRGTAASGLGSLKIKSAVDELFVALDHRVNEAAASIGQLCSGAQCDKLLDKLGKLPFDVVTTGLEQMLFRPTVEMSDDAKVKVIGNVRELGTIEANKFLRDVQKRASSAGMSPRVRQAVDQAVLATSGGAK